MNSIITGSKVILRTPEEIDYPEFRKVFTKEGNHPAPFVYPPLNENDYKNYISGLDGIRKFGFLIIKKSTRDITGVVNISEIVKGAFQNAYLGYYLAGEFEGLGYMSEGLNLILEYSFSAIGLHRLEANIQPSNTRSVNLVKRLGFKLEGFSEKYLKINGEWKDHERWAIIKENWKGKI